MTEECPERRVPFWGLRGGSNPGKRIDIADPAPVTSISGQDSNSDQTLYIELLQIRLAKQRKLDGIKSELDNNRNLCVPQRAALVTRHQKHQNKFKIIDSQIQRLEITLGIREAKSQS